MAQRKTLQELCDERYDDPVVAKMVADDAIAHKTGDAILAGKSTLPHPKDAYRHYLRITGQAAMSAKEIDQSNELKELRERVAALESSHPAPLPTAIREG